LKAREAVQEDSQLNQLALEARRHLSRMKSADAPVVEAVNQVLQQLGTPLEPLSANAEKWPSADWFKTSMTHMEQARADLAAAIGKAMEGYQQAMATCMGEGATQPTEQEIAAVQERFRAACVASGIREDDIARMQGLEEMRQEKLKLVEERQKRLAEVQTEADKFPQVLNELHGVWRSQFDARRTTAEAIQAAVASQTVRLTTALMADEASFKAAWARLAPADKRGKLARRWEDYGDELFREWRRRGDASVWETLEAGRTDTAVLETVLLEGLHQALFVHLDGENTRPLWEDVRISRVSDGIDVELLREDRTVAGSMSGALSEGQRNTVLLNLMLARGEGPIVIDQPEDELDSSFIYRTLVRDLRAAKSKRQLIVATHNANLPVNADAEQIYALEARDGRGKPRAQGGLDRKGVAEAVLDIMEGSEQAFKQRSEKYHF
jgi:hypothetical protein